MGIWRKTLAIWLTLRPSPYRSRRRRIILKGPSSSDIRTAPTAPQVAKFRTIVYPARPRRPNGRRNLGRPAISFSAGLAKTACIATVRARSIWPRVSPGFLRGAHADSGEGATGYFDRAEQFAEIWTLGGAGGAAGARVSTAWPPSRDAGARVSAMQTRWSPGMIRRISARPISRNCGILRLRGRISPSLEI